MSSLGPLFIPRKDNQPIPKTSDNPDLGRYLEQLTRRIHTNELAIQRWANSVPRLAAVMGAGSSVTVTSTGAQPLPMDGVTNSFFPNIVASSQLTIPADGWYTLSMSVLWQTGGIVGDHAGAVEVLVYKNGNTTPGSEVITSGVEPEILTGAPLISIIADYQPFSFTTIFARMDYLQPFAFNAIFTSTAGATSASAKITALALDFLGPTPTAVQ